MSGGGECILCGGALVQSAASDGYCWERQVFTYQRCTECRARVIQPLPSDQDLARMYRHRDYHEASYEECGSGEWPSSLVAARQGARLLDFGCGNGAFLADARKRGFEAVGVELDETAREVAQRNSDCAVLSLEDVLAGDRRFDVIHLGDVLEHLPRPVEALRQLEPLLTGDGVFFVEGPLEENASLVRLANGIVTAVKAALGESSLAPFPPFHLSRSSAGSQCRFFQQVMGYDLMLFEVNETGWPYLLGTAVVTGGAKAKTRRMIGRAAISAAKIGRRFGLSFGNRFVAIAAPAKQRRQIGVSSPAW